MHVLPKRRLPQVVILWSAAADRAIGGAELRTLRLFHTLSAMGDEISVALQLADDGCEDPIICLSTLYSTLP